MKNKILVLTSNKDFSEALGRYFKFRLEIIIDTFTFENVEKIKFNQYTKVIIEVNREIIIRDTPYLHNTGLRVFTSLNDKRGLLLYTVYAQELIELSFCIKLPFCKEKISTILDKTIEIGKIQYTEMEKYFSSQYSIHYHG